MNDQIVHTKQLRVLYSILAVIASVAATKALIWPRWPAARPLDEQAIAKALTNAGIAVSPLRSLAAKRNAEFATSTVIGYSLDDRLELRLMRGVVRKRFNFQLAFLSKSHSELQLKHTKVSAGPPPYVLGLIQRQPAVQTCLVEQSQAPKPFGATKEELWALIDRINPSRWSKLKSIIGLQPNRSYECILIQAKRTGNLTTSINPPTWLRILGSLQSVLQTDTSQIIKIDAKP